jgi:LmbE family N-acetylglucosaminyl deacetylase
MFGKRILILAAHPDDEVVASCAAIGRAQAQGAEIFVLFLTHGCIARAAMWPWVRPRYDRIVARRRREAEAAAQMLGIKISGSGSRPARHLWREMEMVRHEVELAIDRHLIDQIWVPAYEGGNADHDALNAVGGIFRTRLGVLEFAEYNFSGGRAHSQEFPQANGGEQVITLTPAECAKKRAALALYRSEKGNLGYVKTERECCRALKACDYGKPPHEGTLWYARFHWVPFRHPRVDFTKADEVSAAILAFLARAG